MRLIERVNELIPMLRLEPYPGPDEVRTVLFSKQALALAQATDERLAELEDRVMYLEAKLTALATRRTMRNG